MSIRRDADGVYDTALIYPIPLDRIPGVYSCRCPVCGRDFIAGDKAPYVAIVASHVRVVACPRCWRPEFAERIRAAHAAIVAMIPDDPFEGFDLEGAA